jgi:hypothetical protein
MGGGGGGGGRRRRLTKFSVTDLLPSALILAYNLFPHAFNSGSLPQRGNQDRVC